MSFSLMDEILVNYNPVEFERNAKLDGTLNMIVGLVVVVGSSCFLYGEGESWPMALFFGALGLGYMGYALFDLRFRKKKKKGSVEKGILSYRLYNRGMAFYAFYVALKYVVGTLALWPMTFALGSDTGKFREPMYWMFTAFMILFLVVPRNCMTLYQYEIYCRTHPSAPKYKYGEK